MAITFSTIIATYNQTKELEKVLESIEAQSFKDLEVIVADDGSKKDNLSIVRRKWSFPVKYIWHPDTAFNIAKVRNMAARIAKGKYLHIIDGDTLVGEYTYRPYLPYLFENALLWGQRHILNPEILKEKITQENLDKFTIAGDWRKKALYFVFSGANFILPREKYLEILWNENFRWYGFDDYEFYYRWLENNNKTGCVSKSIAYHLDHPAKDGDPNSRELFKRTILRITANKRQISEESLKTMHQFSIWLFGKK